MIACLAPSDMSEKDAKLLYAAQQGKLERMKAALEEGADINAKDCRGHTAIDYLYTFCHIMERMLPLIKRGELFTPIFPDPKTGKLVKLAEILIQTVHPVLVATAYLFWYPFEQTNNDKAFDFSSARLEEIKQTIRLLQESNSS